jgi:hypothetical protein
MRKVFGLRLGGSYAKMSAQLSQQMGMQFQLFITKNRDMADLGWSINDHERTGMSFAG